MIPCDRVVVESADPGEMLRVRVFKFGDHLLKNVRAGELIMLPNRNLNLAKGLALKACFGDSDISRFDYDNVQLLILPDGDEMTASSALRGLVRSCDHWTIGGALTAPRPLPSRQTSSLMIASSYFLAFNPFLVYSLISPTSRGTWRSETTSISPRSLLLLKLTAGGNALLHF